MSEEELKEYRTLKIEVAGYIVGLLLVLFSIIFTVATSSGENLEEQSQIYNDVTFEVIETADSAGDNLIYDTSTGIVYKGGYSAYKPHYSEDGYLYVYRDGRLQEVR